MEISFYSLEMNEYDTGTNRDYQYIKDVWYKCSCASILCCVFLTDSKTISAIVYVSNKRGSVVKCLTKGSWVRAALDPLGFFVGVSLGKTLQSLA